VTRLGLAVKGLDVSVSRRRLSHRASSVMSRNLIVGLDSSNHLAKFEKKHQDTIFASCIVHDTVLQAVLEFQ